MSNEVPSQPPDAAWWLATQLTEADEMPDLWSSSGGRRDGEAIIWRFVYDKDGPGKRVIEVEERDGTWHVISDTGPVKSGG